MNRLQDDAMLRALYRDAQTAVTPATAARLHRARHAASQASTHERRRWALPMGIGATALLALALGMRVLVPGADAPESATGPTPALVAADSAAQFDDGVDDALANYEESPDFYRWLAANESALLAVE